MRAVIEVRDLAKSYGSLAAVDGVSFAVAEVGVALVQRVIFLGLGIAAFGLRLTDFW